MTGRLLQHQFPKRVKEKEGKMFDEKLVWGASGLEIAMDHHERLTNIRYADDLMLYARSLPALVEMIETL